MQSQSIFPKKVILAVLSHGQNLYPPEYFEVPVRQFISLQIAPIGECNYTTEKSINKHLSTINNVLPNLLNASTKEEYQTVFDFIKTSVLEYDIKYNKDANNIENSNVTDIKGYLHNVEDQFRPVIFANDGTKIANKLFSRMAKEKKQGIIDYLVLALNAYDINDNAIDMIDWFNRANRYRQQDIYLSEILDTLQQSGTEDVVLIDFSCDVYVDANTNEYVSERQKRNIRRTLKKERIGGRKTKAGRRKKNKKRRTRKYVR